MGSFLPVEAGAGGMGAEVGGTEDLLVCMVPPPSPPREAMKASALFLTSCQSSSALANTAMMSPILLTLPSGCCRCDGIEVSNSKKV